MGKWLGAVLFFACSSFIPVQARMQVECVTYTVTYPLQDGTVVTESGGITGWSDTPTPMIFRMNRRPFPCRQVLRQFPIQICARVHWTIGHRVAAS